MSDSLEEMKRWRVAKLAEIEERDRREAAELALDCWDSGTAAEIRIRFAFWRGKEGRRGGLR